MSSAFLKCIAAGLVAAVLGSTLWMAIVIHPEPSNAQLLLAQVAPATAASAPRTLIDR